MTNQGGSACLILKQICKAVNRHPQPFVKFSKSAQEIVDDISSG